MGFLKTMYNKLHPAPPAPVLTTDATRAQAESAVERATEDLQAVESNEIQVSAVVSSLRAQLARNHFGEMVEASMRGRM